MADVQVRVAGVGIEQTLTIPEGATLAVALENATDVQAALETLQPRVNGEAVNPADYAPRDGDTIVLVEPNLKLGS